MVWIALQLTFVGVIGRAVVVKWRSLRTGSGFLCLISRAGRDRVAVLRHRKEHVHQDEKY